MSVKTARLVDLALQEGLGGEYVVDPASKIGGRSKDRQQRVLLGATHSRPESRCDHSPWRRRKWPIVEFVEDGGQRRGQRMVAEYGVRGGLADRGLPIGVVEQGCEFVGEIFFADLDEVFARYERIVSGRRLADDATPIGHRLDQARPFEVARHGVIAMQVQQDSAAGQQVVFRRPEDERAVTVGDGALEAEQPQIDLTVPQLIGESGEDRGPAIGLAPHEQQLGRPCARDATIHARHSPEAKVTGIDSGRRERGCAECIDVERDGAVRCVQA